MLSPTRALMAFRRRAIDEEMDRALPAIFLLEPGMCRSAAVIASWRPVSSLQLLGVTEHASAGAARATVEHAVDRLGARTLVVCAERTLRPDQARDRERLLGGCLGLSEDPSLGPLLRDRGVSVEALWFDTSAGDIHGWNAGSRRFELLADTALERFFAEVFERASSSLPRIGART